MRKSIKVSIILPTYNRAEFLHDALKSISDQSFSDWELIIVDDGSTDDTPEIIDELTGEIDQPVRYHRQENRGAYGARNAGLDLARGKYVAFYDSDDRWLPHHLNDCVEALEANLDVDWVYGALKRIDSATGEVLLENSFYTNGTPKPLLRLKRDVRGDLHVIQDSLAVSTAILRGIGGGLHSSVIRQKVFENYRFNATFRNGQDRFAVIEALIHGHSLGFLNQIHLIYRVHSENDSLSRKTDSVDRKRVVQDQIIQQYEELLCDERLSAHERRAVRKRLVRECFWSLGYATYWQNGKQEEALSMFRRGLKHWPWDYRCWKTFLISSVRKTDFFKNRN